MKIRKILSIVLMCVLLLLSFAGCAAAEKSTASTMAAADNVYGVADDYLVKEEAEDAESGSSMPVDRKLIQTVYLDVETEDLDAVLQQIDTRIAELAGYIEVSNVQNGSAYQGKRYRHATVTIRIPAADLDSFIDKVGEMTNIVSSKKTVEDITLNYVATESRMKALQTEEARLLELLAQAESIEDLLTIESRLTDVRTELEQVTSALRVFDNQVNYATIHLTVEEVTEYTEVTEPETVWQRIGRGFAKSLKGVGNFFVELFVFLIVASPYLLLIAGFFTGIGLLIHFSVRRSEKKRAKQIAAQKAAKKEQDG